MDLSKSDILKGLDNPQKTSDLSLFEKMNAHCTGGTPVASGENAASYVMLNRQRKLTTRYHFKMRNLFESEMRTIHSLGMQKWGITLPLDDIVIINESYLDPQSLPAPAQKYPIFNLDFRLDFTDKPRPSDDLFAVECTLPNAIGGSDLFLSIDQATMSPLILSLTLGPVFPMRFFLKYIKYIDVAVNTESHYRELKSVGIFEKKVKQAFNIKNSKFCRVFVIDSDICFLWLMQEERPSRCQFKKVVLTENKNAFICCYIDDLEIIGVDGWINFKS